MAGVITLHLGDITTDRDADAIVNAANSSLLGGGGVDGASTGGRARHFLGECRGCWAAATPATPEITGAGRLPASRVIHAVGPVWHGGGDGEAELLASCYRRAIELAAEHGCAGGHVPPSRRASTATRSSRAATVALTATEADALAITRRWTRRRLGCLTSAPTTLAPVQVLHRFAPVRHWVSRARRPRDLWSDGTDGTAI